MKTINQQWSQILVLTREPVLLDRISKGQRQHLSCSLDLPLVHLSSLYLPVAEKLRELDRIKNTACTRNVNQRLLKTLTLQESAFQFRRPQKEREVRRRYFFFKKTDLSTVSWAPARYRHAVCSPRALIALLGHAVDLHVAPAAAAEGTAVVRTLLYISLMLGERQ